MKHQRCVDYRIVDPDHVVILYTFQLVVVSLKEVETFEGNGPRGCIVPLNVIKFEVE